MAAIQANTAQAVQIRIVMSEEKPRIEVTVMVNDGEPTEFREEVFIAGIYGFSEVHFNDCKETAIQQAWEQAEYIDYPKDAFSVTLACTDFIQDEVDTGLAIDRYMMCENVEPINFLVQSGQQEPEKVEVE